MNRQELLEHANNLYLTLKEDRYRISRHWEKRLQYEIERLGKFIFHMDELMGHKNWNVCVNY